MNSSTKTQEKGLLLLYLRKLVPTDESLSADVILSFRHDMSPLHLPCYFLEEIEVPIYENDSFFEIKLDLYVENKELKLVQRLTFEELGLPNDSIRSYSLIFESKDYPKYQFFLIFDAFFKSSLSGSKNLDNNIMKIKVQEFKNLSTFLSKRQMVNREKHLLKKNISLYQYFLQLSYFEQKFGLEISLDELESLNVREFFFIFDRKEVAHPFTVEILECEYEKLTPEDDLTFTGSLCLESFSRPLAELMNTEFQVEDSVHGLIIKFSSDTDTSNYLLKMPTHTGFKLLSSTLFDSNIKDAFLVVKCLNNQNCWSMTPVETENSQEKTQLIWNPQYSLINAKALGETNQANDDFKLEFDIEDLRKRLTALKPQSHLLKFEALLVKYRNMHRYDKVLGSEELKFQNKINEILFVNETPYDYVTFELFDRGSKEKKGVCQVCLMDLEETTMNLEFLMDPKLNVIVGTMSFLVEFQGGRGVTPDAYYKGLDTKLMLNYDDFNRMNYTRILSNNQEYYNEMEKAIRKTRGNFFTLSQRMCKFRLELEEIWNSRELFTMPGVDYSVGNFSLVCRIASSSYAIPLAFLAIPLDKIKEENPGVYKSLLYEKQTQTILTKQLKNSDSVMISIYFLGKNSQEVVCLSFEKSPNFEVLIENPFVKFSCQLNQKSNILLFHKGLIKDLLVFKDKGSFLIGMEVKNVKRMSENAGFHPSSVFLKFSFGIREDLDYDRGNYTEGLYQILQVKDERNLAKGVLKDLRQSSYELVLKDEAKNVLAKQALRFSEGLDVSSLLGLYEWRKTGGLSVLLEVYRLFSEDDEEYQINVMLNGLNSKSKLIHSSQILLNFLDIDLPSKAIKVEVNPNSYLPIALQVCDTRISLKSKDLNTKVEFPLQLLVLYKCNKLIGKIETALTLEIPESTLQYYLSNGYATSGNSLKFSTISTGSKQSSVFSFKGKSGNKEQSARIVFDVKKYTQIIIVQMLNSDNNILDSDSIKVADLVYSLDDRTQLKHTVLFNNKPFVVLISFGADLEEKKQAEEKKSEELSRNGESRSRKSNSKVVAAEANDEKSGKKPKLSEVDQLKLRIQSVQKENASLATQLTREQKLIVAKRNTIDELESIIKRAEAGPVKLDKRSKPLDQAKINKARELFNAICVCGAPNPRFKGYCKECLQKMKDEYEKALNEYLPLSEKLENLSLKSMNHVSKMGQLWRKIENMKVKIRNFDLGKNEANEEKFLQEDLNYYKEKQTLLEAEIDMTQRKYEKLITAKQNEQKQTEQKLVQKSERLSKFIEDTEVYLRRIKNIENELKKMSEELLIHTQEEKNEEEKKAEGKKAEERKVEEKGKIQGGGKKEKKKIEENKIEEKNEAKRGAGNKKQTKFSIFDGMKLPSKMFKNP